MRFAGAVGIALLGLGRVFALGATGPGEHDPVFDHAYRSWAEVLGRCAADGTFQYDLLKTDGELMARLDLQQAQFELVTAQMFQKFSRDQRLAFLINAHNVYAADQASQKLSDGGWGNWFRSPQKRRNIRLAGRKWSLHSLREEIMGPGFYEPRAIFALNWGDKECAPLAPVPATAQNLEQFLEARTAAFIRDPRFNRYAKEETIFFASPLLKEYRKEIERNYATLWGFLQHFVESADAERMQRFPPRIRFR